MSHEEAVRLLRMIVEFIESNGHQVNGWDDEHVYIGKDRVTPPR